MDDPEISDLARIHRGERTLRNLQRKSWKTVFLGSQNFVVQLRAAFVDSIWPTRNRTCIPNIPYNLRFTGFSRVKKRLVMMQNDSPGNRALERDILHFLSRPPYPHLPANDATQGRFCANKRPFLRRGAPEHWDRKWF
jgi:hypothetical protein